ncbi:MAG: hypothetical protein ACT4RN_13400 [Pseudonocardia sp.]
MLLLVLILVLVAFALLVVALVQGSVLWAWLSVVISVAAAGALLFDWWQRQQALRAEEESLPAPAGVPDRPVRPRAVSADVDSVTEFIPVLPQPGYPGGAAPGQDRYPQEADTRFLPQGSPAGAGAPEAGEETILLPVARPPGSADQPSGATHGSASWGESQSQRVTNSEGMWTGQQPPEAPGASPPGEETVFQPVGSPDRADTPEPRSNGLPDGAGAAAGGTTAQRRVDGPPGSAADDATTAVPAQQAAPADTEMAMPALPPAGSDGEPPEEALVAAAAAVAAAAQDEVVVVDERPRYHLGTCPFLPGRPVIPLPAREAVELGFSPCGWCEPNRMLADRHQPATR